MKNSLIYIMILCLFWSCSDDEDNPNVGIEKDRYSLHENPEGKVQEFIYNIQKNFGTVLLLNPKESDYKYNFTSVNKIKVIPALDKDIYVENLSDEEEQVILKSIDLLNEVFLDKYTDEFKKKFMPVSIQLCSEIKQWDQGLDTIYPLSYSSHNMIQISGINKDLNTITDEKKQEYKGDINKKFWHDCLYLAKKSFHIPRSFFEISKEYYGGYENLPPTAEDLSLAYDNGFIDVKSTAIGDWGFYHSEEEDVELYINYLFTHSQEEISNIVDNYPKVKIKYDIIRETILKETGFDIKSF
ncbi:MAG: hypothetical protein N4A49_05215 [Marinifilaceae bacterium]|nr:hypothetical protein [Marinifilaceae bacterium]